MDKVTVIACLCIVVLGALRPSATGGSKVAYSLAAWCVGLLLGSFVLSRTMQLLGYCPASSANGYVSFNINKVRESTQKLPKNVLLLEGGSCGARALNYRELEDQLRARGYSVMVLQFCSPGASHFERLYTLKQFLRGIGQDILDRLNERNVLLLSEVYRSYDLDPMAQFSQNLYSSRTLAYLQPSIALEALHASRLSCEFDGGNKLSYKLKLELIKHALLNAFNVGFFNRSEVLAAVPQTEPVYALNSKKEQFETLNCNAAQLTDELGSVSNLPPLDLRWKRVIDSEWKASGLKYRQVFFATPSLSITDLRYLAQYQRTFTAKPFLWFKTDHAFLKSLADSECWYDQGHLSARGSQLCTPWFADKISESGLLVR